MGKCNMQENYCLSHLKLGSSNIITTPFLLLEQLAGSHLVVW